MLEKITNSSKREEAIGRRFMGSLTPYVLSVLLALTAYSVLGCKKKEPVDPGVGTNVEAIFSGNEEANSWSTPKKNCLLGLYFVEKGDIEQAMPLLKKAIELDPEYSRAYYGLGHAHMISGNRNEAIANFSLAIKHDPNNCDAHKYRANLLLSAGDLDGALADCDRVIELKPDSGAHCSRGVVLFKKGRYQEAEEAYGKAHELDPDSIGVYVNRGILFEELGKLDDALTDFSQALALKQGDTFILYNRGCVYGKQGKMDLAKADFETVISTDPNNGGAHLNLAYIYKGQGNDEKMTTHMDRAMELKAIK